MKSSSYAVAAAAALVLAPALVQGQTTGTAPAANAVSDPIDIRRWDMTALRSGYSAERLIDTSVRGDNGKSLGEVHNFLVDKDGRITGIIVESQGFMEIGDTHFFVPWKEVKVGPKLDWVQVPVNERTLPNFSLFNDDESIYKPGATYRGKELLSEFVRLKGGLGYGYVDDVVFSADGKIQAIVVSPDMRYGYGRYAYPYYGGLYRPGLGYYNMPYGRDDLAGLKPFDYSALGIAPDQDTAKTRSPKVTQR